MNKTYFLSIFLLLITQKSFSQFKVGDFLIPPMNESFMILGQHSESDLDPEKIDVLVWNVLKGKRKAWAKDFIQLSKNQNIILLQEVFLNNNMLDTFYRLDASVYFSVSFMYQVENNFIGKRAIPTGSAIVSNFAPTYSYMIRSTELEPFIQTPKTITYAYYNLKGTHHQLLVFNIHGLNITTNKTLNTFIKKSLPIINNHSGPILFAGDFNTWSRRRRSQVRNILGQVGLREVHFESKDRKSFLGSPLDLAFIRGLEVLKADVPSEIESSDHKPMVLSLKLIKL